VTTEAASTTVRPAASARERSCGWIHRAGRTEGGLLGGHAFEARALGRGAARIQDHDAVGEGDAAADLVAADADLVLVGLEAEVVAQVTGGQDDAQVGGDLAAQGGDPAGQLAALLVVDEAEQAVAHLQLEGVDVD
jgi:hypothetical protein